MRQLAANRVWFSVRAALGWAALAVGGCWGRPDFIIYFYPEDANDETDAENDADSGPYVVEPQHGTASWRCSGGVLEEQRSDGTWERAWDCRTSGRICDARTTSCLQRCQSDTDCATGPDGSERQCRSDGRCASRVFETVWAIEDDDLLLTLPFFDDGSRTAKCNYRVLWGDEPKGTRIEDQQPIRNCPSVDPMAHKYKSKGDYYIKILGIYNGWGTDIAPVVSGCEKASLTRRKEVVSFGSVGLTSGAFACTHNVKLPVNEIPNPQNWTNAEGMFLRAKGISDRISAWDTSGVLNMVMAFYAANEFDHSLRYWDTSNVVTMRGMF